MKPVKITLPALKQGGLQIKFNLGLHSFNRQYFEQIKIFRINSWVMVFVLMIICLIFYQFNKQQEEVTRVYQIVEYEGNKYLDQYGNAHEIEFPFETFKKIENIKQTGQPTNPGRLFLERKKSIFQKYVRKTGLTISGLNNQTTLEMNKELSDAFIQDILLLFGEDEEGFEFFSNTEDLFKIETALMEQKKYGIPASITLAQAAIATSFGESIPGNNYFKLEGANKNGFTDYKTVFLSTSEIEREKDKIISKKVKPLNGMDLYECKVKVYLESYQTPWQSFRAHSTYLSENRQFKTLFDETKDYRRWVEKLGPKKFGGLGYHASPEYPKMLKEVIQKYHLYLLDH
ncbi:glucosaminidase domain-containing protein [Flexithrix dorotheae]|uniref:glucosaminidase domain-containing protein n=1 Tax=Flexithrix dorotheae TaxID=70993 RepID=UPI00036B305F|nr:glucosaminidase domain-containing protein [Flexithrix dorotheae]